MVVNDLVIVELKAAKDLCEEHEAHLINYLKAAIIEAGMLLNIGVKGVFKRKIFTNDRKSIDTDHPDAAGLHRLNPWPSVQSVRSVFYLCLYPTDVN